MTIVAVFGDPMRDVYWVGTADRLSPEGPIPVVKVKEKVELPGGAANVVANLEAQGVHVIRGYNGLVCPVKNRLVVGEYQLARWDEKDRCYENFVDDPGLGERIDAVVVSDYGKGGVTERVRKYVLGLGKPLFVDTKDQPLGWLTEDDRTVVFPNQGEYDRFGVAYDKFNLCVLKQGGKGLTLMSRGKEWAHFPATAKRVVSVNGAGDTVLAAFVARYLEDGSWESKANRAAKWANQAAGVAVGKMYTSVVTKKEVESAGS